VALRIKVFGGPTTGTTIPTFTDNFNRANNPLVVTYPWQIWGTGAQLRFANMTVPGSPCGMQSLTNGVQVIGNQLVLESAGAGGVIFQVRSFITPAPFWGPEFAASPGHSQFSEFKLISDNSVALLDVTRYGPSTLCQQQTPNFFNVGGGYYLEMRAESGTLQLYRGLGGGGTGTGSTSLGLPVAAAFVAGDTIRLETVVEATKNTNTVKVNGVTVIGPLDDSDASRPKFGVPGIGWTFQGTNAIFSTIDDYSGGPL
jgi:hypothetical protein